MATPTTRTVSIFDAFDLKRAEEEVKAAFTVDIKTSKLFFKGDHWQDGAGWTGPIPDVGATNYQDTVDKVKKNFTSKNCVAEVVNRHADSVLARSRSCWYLSPSGVGDSSKSTQTGGQLPQSKGATVPTVQTVADPSQPGQANVPPEQPLIDEILPVLNLWWDKREVVKHLRVAVEQLLYAKRGGLRLFIPEGKLVNGEIPRLPIEELIDLIYLESPDVENATMVLDYKTMDTVYCSVTSRRNQEAKKNFKYCEISFVESISGLTVLKLESDDPQSTTVETVIDLGRRNLAFEMTRDPLVTEQVRQNQAAVNKALTMMQRNTDLAGFLERVILGADVPGEWVTDNTAPNGKRYQPKPIRMGAGSNTVLKPFVTEDDDGKKYVLMPDIRYRDPIDPKSFIDSWTSNYHCILQDCEQTHMIIAGDAFASGEARIQARANFATSLLRTKPEVDSMIIWLVETLIKMLGAFSGNAEKYDKLKAVCDIRPDTGPLTPEEKRIVIEQYNKGLMSREAAMVLLGCDNPDEEVRKIEAEKKVTTPMEKAGIMTALSKTGWELSLEQLPSVDADILGLEPRNLDSYKAWLEFKAELQAPVGGNSGDAGGSPKGSTNQPGSDSPGPSSSDE